MSLNKPAIHDPAALLRPAEAAELVGVEARALEAWRNRGSGPRYVKVSPRCIRYRRIDLIEWAERRLQSTTAEDGTALHPGAPEIGGIST